MTEEGGVAVCPKCTIGSLLAMDSLSGGEAVPSVSSGEVFDEVVPGVDLLMIKGSGGMGTVLKGRQLSLDRDVAVKIIRRDRADDPAYEAALREEAGSMARLDHPGIVRVLDFGRTLGGSLYLLLEWVEGISLRQLLDRRGALSPEEAADLILPLCAALQHAHDHCVVHRDLKPENILLTSDGQPKLADFGLARLGGRATTFVSGGAKPSRSASTVGTPAYMAPEQAGGAAVVDRRADLYALALILQEMLTGQRPEVRPVSGQSGEVMPSVDPSKPLPASTPPGLRELVRHNLSNQVEERADSARVFAEDFRRALAPRERLPATPEDSTFGVHRVSRRGWLVTAGALALGGAAGAAWSRRRVAGRSATAIGFADRPDPQQAEGLVAHWKELQQTLVAKKSPPVVLVPSLSLGPQMPLRPALTPTQAGEMDLPVEAGLAPADLELRLVRFAEAHVRCYDSDSPRAPELTEDGHIDTGTDESGFLNIGRQTGGQFKEKWSKYVQDYPHLYSQVLGVPAIRPGEPGVHEAQVVLWSRFGTGHRFAKLETSLRLDIVVQDGQPLRVRRIRKSESTIVPHNADEVRLALFKMTKLVLETLAPENALFLPAFFERRHYHRGRTRERSELEGLVAARSPQLERSRVRLVSGPEVFKHDTWLHTGVFLAEALKDLPEEGVKAGHSCLVIVTMHFEKIWPLIRSFDIRPLSGAGFPVHPTPSK